jgi:site-specific recombinase XerC
MTEPVTTPDIVPETATDLPLLTVSWVRHLRAANLSPKTIRGYGEAVRLFDGFLADMGMPRLAANIRREHCEAFIEGQLERWQPATAVARYSPLRRFFDWLVEEGEISASPMARMPKPKVPEHVVAFPTPGELKAVLGTCGKDFTGRRDEAILRTFISTGCRLAELAGLRYTPSSVETNDLDLDGERVRLMGKGRRQRISHLDRQAVRALDRYLRLRSGRLDADSQWLWLGKKGRLTDSGISQMVKQRGQAAGIDLHPHMLRHYYAHRQLSRGMAEGDLMTLAGWRSREMLSRYAAASRTDRALASARRLSADDDL